MKRYHVLCKGYLPKSGWVMRSGFDYRKRKNAELVCDNRREQEPQYKWRVVDSQNGRTIY